MRRSWATAILIVACAPTVRAGTITFNPLTPVSVPAGTSIQYEIALQGTGTFDLTNIVLGALATVTDLTFVTDADWDLAFASGATTLLYDEPAPPAFENNVFLEGVLFSGTAGPNLSVGTLTVDTLGMAPDAYSVVVNPDDSYTSNSGEGNVQIPLLSSGVIFVVTPEPATALLLLAGAAALVQRRRAR